jgi:hypothetical protein
MPRLTAPNGATVSVSDDKAARLLKQDYKPVEEPKKAPAKKSASSSKSSK